MGFFKSRFILLCAALSLGGCSFATDALFPVWGDETEPAPPPPAQTASSDSDNRQFIPPPLEPTALTAIPAIPAPVSNFGGLSTNTFVSQKVSQFRGELNQLRGTISASNQQLGGIRGQTAANATSYHGIVGGIKSRLQVGTTPGNPQLLSQWQSAQNQLGRIENDVSSMSQLSAQVAADSAVSSYLLDSVRAAYGLTGAVDEDHRQLRLLEDEVSQNTVTINRLLQELNSDIVRQQQYVANEREALVGLATDINAGQLYRSRATANAEPQVALATSGDLTKRRPLVLIRFDRANVEYEAALYQAVNRALERRPAAIFDLVAVSPGTGNQDLNTGVARRNAEAVLQSLSAMGLPADRVMLSAVSSPTAPSAEVHIYVR